MRRTLFASLFVLAGLVRAAEVASSAPQPAAPARTEPPAVVTQGTEGRSVSPETAAKLTAAAPKFEDTSVGPITPYSSPVGTPQSVVGETSDTDLSTSGLLDQARNKAIQMPQVIVGEPRIHVPDPVQVLTPKGKVDLAFRRWPGLRIVPFGWMNAKVGLEMLEDEMQAQRRRQAADLLSLYLIR